jgi:hypothetical protein
MDRGVSGWIREQLRRWPVRVGAGLVLTPVVLVLVLRLGPVWMIGPHGDLDDAERLNAINAARASLVQLFGGVALFAGLLLTARTYLLSRRGQITDRYASAVDQLGSANVSVRTGGVYALEQVTTDAPDYVATVSEVLAAYVRERTDHRAGAAVSRDGRRPGRRRGNAALTNDVQAALTVLGRRHPDRVLRRLDLRHCDLTGADLQGARLQDADLTRSHLDAANCVDARLQRAKLGSASLRGADLSGAMLGRADLAGADLGGATLHLTDLAGAVFTGCRVDRCDLSTAKNLSPDQLAVATGVPSGLPPGLAVR